MVCVYYLAAEYTRKNTRFFEKAFVSVPGKQYSDPDRNHFRQVWFVGIIPGP